MEYLYVCRGGDAGFFGGAGFAELMNSAGCAPVYCHSAFFEVGEGGGGEVFVVFDLCVPYASAGGGDEDVFHVCCVMVVNDRLCRGW